MPSGLMSGPFRKIHKSAHLVSLGPTFLSICGTSKRQTGADGFIVSALMLLPNVREKPIGIPIVWNQKSFSGHFL